MFYGYNQKPAFLKRCKDLKVKRERRNVCSRDKGKCRGSWVRKQLDGTTKVQFAYLDMPEGHTLAEYQEACRTDRVVFDDGVWEVKCTVEFDGNIYSWYEEEKND